MPATPSMEEKVLKRVRRKKRDAVGDAQEDNHEVTGRREQEALDKGRFISALDPTLLLSQGLFRGPYRRLGAYVRK